MSHDFIAIAMLYRYIAQPYHVQYYILYSHYCDSSRTCGWFNCRLPKQYVIFYLDMPGFLKLVRNDRVVVSVHTHASEQ